MGGGYTERQTRVKEFDKPLTPNKFKSENRKLTKQYTKRTTSGLLKIGLDRERIMNRLATKKFIKISEHKKTTTERGISNRAISTLHEYDIVQYYNSIIWGFINYYSPCLTDSNYLNFLIFLLNTSCSHTLAQKYNTRLPKIRKKYGDPIKISIDKTSEKQKHQKRCEL